MSEAEKQVKEFVSSSGKKYLLKALTFGEACDIQDASTVLDDKTGLPKIATRKLRGLRLQRFIVAPKLTVEQVEELPEGEALELEGAYRNLNSLPLGNLPG